MRIFLALILSSVSLLAQPFKASQQGQSRLHIGLVSYWKLDESTGTRRDWAGPHNLTVVGGVGSDTGIINNAATFAAGANNYLTVTNTAFVTGTNPFTISLWFYRTNACVSSSIIRKSLGAATNSEFALVFSTTSHRLLATMYSADGTFSQIADTYATTTNTWYHTTLFYDPAAQFFGISLNGREITKVYADVHRATNVSMTIGGSANATQVQGKIDEVAFWNRCLSPIERAELYNNNSAISFPRFQPPSISAQRNPYVTIVSDGAYNAFPGIAVLPNGSYLATYYAGNSHDDTNATYKYRISTDRGATWGAASTTGRVATRGGDISLIGTNIVWAESVLTNTTSLCLWKGGVDGDTITWTNTGAIANSYTDYFFTASRVAALANGDWLLPVYVGNTGDPNWSTAVIVSSDEGATWGTPVVVAAGDATYEYTEAGAAQVSGGRVYLVIRVDTNQGYKISQSDDNGATWSAPEWIYQGEKPGYPSILATDSGIILWTRWQLDPENANNYGIHILGNRGLLGSWQTPIITGNDEKSMYQSIAVINSRSVICAWAEQSAADVNISAVYFATYQHD